MGQILFSENQPANAGYCFERAVELAPYSPPMLLEAAAFSHAMGRCAEGLGRMKHVLAQTREYDKAIFSLYGRVADVSTVLAQGLPPDAGAGRAYFAYLLEARDLRAARLVWDWLSVHDYVDTAVARRYLLFLIAEQLHDEAAETFARLLPAAERAAAGNRVTHGGFEAGGSGLPLDWAVAANAHAEVRRDDSCSWEGVWSLRIEFDGKDNLEYRHIAQQAVVSSGRWKLSARIRTQGISSDQGIGLRIFDARSASKWQVWSGTVSGDSPWTAIEETVTIPAETPLVQVEIVRRPSRKLDNKLGGIVWIDEVSLTPLRAPTQPGKPPAPSKTPSRLRECAG
jgi:hypothetical protein